MAVEPKTRREDILEVAAEIFSEKGYRAATLNDVAQAMGFTRAALYYYFDNKQEMLTALFETAGAQLVAQMEEHLAAEVEIPEKLRRILLSHALAFMRRPHLFTVFQAEVSELPADGRNRLVSGERGYVGAIASLIEQGMDDGIFERRPAMPTALAVLGMANSVARWYRPGRGLTSMETAELIVDLCLGGLYTRTT